MHLQPHAPLLRNFCLLTSPHHASTRAHHYLASAWPDNCAMTRHAKLSCVVFKRERCPTLKSSRSMSDRFEETETHWTSGLQDVTDMTSKHFERHTWHMFNWTFPLAQMNSFQQSFFLLCRCIDTRWYKHISCDTPFTSLSIFHLLDRWFQGITQTNFEHVFANKTYIS